MASIEELDGWPTLKSALLFLYQSKIANRRLRILFRLFAR
jgi:hypothetical protein